MYEIKLSDLRQLGYFGNATAKLDKKHNFAICEIRKDGIYVPQKNCIVAGKRSSLKIHHNFASIYTNILTVKQGKLLVAERDRNTKKLVATTRYEQSLKNAKNQKA
ncbi:hypothetical protein RyT2_29570 [Pseudolactococcus yaeyamensis]